MQSCAFRKTDMPPQCGRNLNFPEHVEDSNKDEVGGGDRAAWCERTVCEGKACNSHRVDGLRLPGRACMAVYGSSGVRHGPVQLGGPIAPGQMAGSNMFRFRPGGVVVKGLIAPSLKQGTHSTDR